MKRAILITVLFFIGCNQKDNLYINFYDKNITLNPPKCLRLNLSPFDKKLEDELKTIYKFDFNCSYTLYVEYKKNIHCNKNLNANIKGIKGLPIGYIRAELKKGFKLLYSYYIDLDHNPNSNDFKEALERVVSDLNLKD